MGVVLFLMSSCYSVMLKAAKAPIGMLKAAFWSPVEYVVVLYDFSKIGMDYIFCQNFLSIFNSG